MDTERVEKLARLYNWTQGELNDKDKEFIEQIKGYFGKYTKVKILEALLDYYKKASDTIIVKDIPDELQSEGLTNVTTKNGIKISLKPYYNFKKKENAIEWLFENGFADIVKNDIYVGTGYIPDEVLDVLDQTGLDYSIEQEVHPQTLKAALTDYVQKGGSLPEDAFEMSVFTKAKISED